MILAGLIIIFGLLHGLVEGVVMIRAIDPMAAIPPNDPDLDGVRVHRWFWLYHRGKEVRYGLVAAISVFAALTVTGVIGSGAGLEPVFLAGAGVMAWQMAEMAYNYARYRQFVVGHENVLGIFAVNGDAVTVIHLARVLIGIGLLIGGML